MIRKFSLLLVAVTLFAFLAVMPVLADNGWSGAAGPTPPGGSISVSARVDPNYIPPADTIDSNGMFVPPHSIGETIELSGENTASDMTYLFITGPGLPENGAQIHNPDPAHSPLENGNPVTFQQTAVKSDHKWSWKWDTANYILEKGTYTIYVVPRPNDKDHLDQTIAYGFTFVAFKNPAGSATVSPSITTLPVTIPGTTISSAAAQPTTSRSGNEETVLPGVVTIVANGTRSYNLGNEIVFTGTNTAGYKTYLFITGPGLAPNGSQIHTADPKHSPVENGNPGTFKQMDVQGDHTWSWKWGTANTALDTGTYTIYAVGRPYDKDHLEKTPYGMTSITLRKPPESATTIATTTPVPPTDSPGYGAPITLIGLGAVAFIAIRRR
jgi:PGF-CTERM protein